MMVPLLQLSNFRKLSLQLSIEFKKTALIKNMSESNVIILRKDAKLNDI